MNADKFTQALAECLDEPQSINLSSWTEPGSFLGVCGI